MTPYQTQGSASFRPTALTIDTHKYYENDDCYLDENLMDSSLDMSPPTTDGSRRESFAVFSPKTQVWTPVVDLQPTLSSNPFVDTNTNSFIANQQNSIMAQHQPWRMNDAISGQGLLQFDGLPVDIRNTAFRPIQGQTPFSTTGDHVTLFSPSTATHAAASTSPQDDWIVPDDHDDHAPKRMRLTSPGSAVQSPLLRKGDGIRKKNARFDIPAGRTLINIDRLISESSDDQEIRELKQQKRLLRNRQAALDSRQRKKQHTERLEDEKKQFTGLVQDLEKELIESQHREDELRYQLQEYQSNYHRMQMEREDMCRTHTQEILSLRQKINSLTESVHRPITPALSATNFSLQEYDSLVADNWNIVGQEAAVKSEATHPSHATVAAQATEGEVQSNATQGILLTILLLGAFVARQGSMLGVPRLSDGVQTVSTSILEDVSTSIGVKGTSSAISMITPPADVGMIARTSGAMWSGSSTDTYQNETHALSNFAHRVSLTTSIDEHNQEQLFSTPATCITDFMSSSLSSTRSDILLQSSSQNLNAIAATFDLLKQYDEEKCAGTYTLNTLWNQVPPDTAAQFVQLMGNNNLTNYDL